MAPPHMHAAVTHGAAARKRGCVGGLLQPCRLAVRCRVEMLWVAWRLHVRVGATPLLRTQAEYAEGWRPRVRRVLAAERERRLVVLEVGAGTAVPSVRNEAESYLEPQAAHRQCTVVRINPTPVRGDNSTPGVLSIAWGAEEAIACIAARIRSLARAAAADAALA